LIFLKVAPLAGLFILTSSLSLGAPLKSTVITGDKLTYNYKKRSAEVVGQAKIVRDKSTFTSQRLKVFFDEEGNLLSAEARGKVKINFEEENIRGEADSVDYFARGKKIVLSGNPRIWQGENEISGKKITIIIKEEKEEVIVDEEVKAIFIFEKAEEGE
jgi:lipopolysaccharide export system protein LptA